MIASSGNAKLISANDTSNFTFRGRFTDDSQAATVSYEASQKAHNALQWLQRSRVSGRCSAGGPSCAGTPQGIQVCHAAGRFGRQDQVIILPSDYRRELKNTLDGMRSQLPEQNGGVVVAAFDAATSGRLSVTYYNELQGSDYLQRLHDWMNTAAGFSGWDKFKAKSAIQAPLLWRIIACAFGTPAREKGQLRLKTDDKNHGPADAASCRLPGGPGGTCPWTSWRPLFHRASTPQSFDDPAVREEILSTACAVIRKYRYDVL